MSLTRLSRSSLEPWLLAARPRTLPAAISPVIAGTAAAFYSGHFRPLPALAALAVGVLIQIGANLANDVFDHLRGADTASRVGPTRVTHAGLLTPRQVLAGMWAVLALAALIGLYLAWLGGWPVVVVGILCIGAAVAYTAGPYPLAYIGLGDPFAFVFFGLIAVCGTYYVQAGSVSALAAWAAVPMGFLVTAILVVNNLRDISEDRSAGKMTLAVRIGPTATRAEYTLLLGGAFLAPLFPALGGAAPWTLLLTWLALPSAVRVSRLVLHEQGRILNRALAATAQLELYYSILLAVGFVLGYLV